MIIGESTSQEMKQLIASNPTINFILN